MAKIVQEFANLQKCVMAFTYKDGSVAIECSYFAHSEDETTLFHKLEISPEGAKILTDMLVRDAQLRIGADDAGQKATCPKDSEHDHMRNDIGLGSCPECGVAF